MLSLIGCTGIVLGTIGMLWAWEEQQILKSRYLQEMYCMFRKGKYMLVGQQKRCTDFFREYQSAQGEITEACNRIGEKLLYHEVAFGEQAWREVWQTFIPRYHLTKEEREVLMMSGCAFFGKNLKETEELFGVYQGQYDQLTKQCRQTHKERRKVVLPVGALSGVMLIILLI